MVQEASVSLVSTVAETGQEGFGRFYDVVMPFLMQVRIRRVAFFCCTFLLFRLSTWIDSRA